MIKNADLYDLINISLKSKEQHTNESVEEFIYKALEKRNQASSRDQKAPLTQQQIAEFQKRVDL
jgi:hypothetical protein